MGISAFAIMWGLKKFLPRLPGVLIAVALTTIVSWAIGFEHNSTGKIDEIMDAEVKTLANDFSQNEIKIDELNKKLGANSAELKQRQQDREGNRQRVAALNYETELLRLELKDAEGENRNLARSMRKFIFEKTTANEPRATRLYLSGQVPQGEKSDGHRWRIRKVSKANSNWSAAARWWAPSRRPARPRRTQFQLGDDDNAVFRCAGDFAGGLHGSHLHRQGHRGKNRDRIDPNQNWWDRASPTSSAASARHFRPAVRSRALR